MKKYFTILLFASGLLLLPPGTSQAHITPKKIKSVQMHPAKLANTSKIVASLEQNQEKIVVGGTMKNSAVAVPSHSRKRVKNTRKARASAQAPPVFTGGSGLEELRLYYQNWRGTRYQAGGTSHAGVDCSGFTTLTFRDVYGLQLPRTAREQAMQGMSVDRDGLLPGDLVFFKRPRGGNHVGIYLGNGNFMHASTRQGVTISSIDNAYWHNKFWKGSRLL